MLFHNNVIDELRNNLLKNNIKSLEYPLNVTSLDGYVDDSKLIDHAHFHQDIYMELLGFKNLDIESL